MNLFKRPVEKNNSIYLKILLTMILSVMLTAIVISSVLYGNFGNMLQENAYNSELNFLQQSSYSAEILSEFATSLAKQIYYDEQFKELRMGKYPAASYVEYANSVQRLNTLRTLTDFVNSIYVYNSQAGYTITAPFRTENVYELDQMYDKQIIDIIRNYSDYGALKPIPRKLPYINTSSGSSYINAYTFLFYEYPGENKPLSSAVVLNIHESWMKITINQLKQNDYNNVTILDRAGNTLISSDTVPMLTDISNKRYISKVLLLCDKNESGYFIDTVDNTKSLIVYSYYKPYDWIYISTIDYGTIISEVNKMKIYTLIVSFIIILLGAAISLLQSRKLYTPIRSAFFRLTRLEAVKRISDETEKNAFLRSVIFGEVPFSSYKAPNDAGNALFRIDSDAKVILILILIDKYQEFLSRNNSKDRELMKFAVMNIATELLGNDFHCEGTDLGENKIAYIVNIPEVLENDYHDSVTASMNDIFKNANKHLGISLSCAISSVGSNVSAVGSLYDSVSNAAYYRLFCGYGCIVFSDIIERQYNEDYVYPVNKEKVFIEDLVAGDVEDAKRQYNEIIDIALQSSYAMFYLTLSHLAFAVNTAIVTIEKNSGIKIFSGLNEFVSKLGQLETLDQISEHFFQLFDQISAKLTEARSEKHDNAVKKILQIIIENYNDPNLSVSSIADSLNISSVYASRLFKSTTAKSIVDYISEVRMEKAKELLLTSNKTINDIVDLTGFTNKQYFHKMFRKSFGVTPNELRKTFVKL